MGTTENTQMNELVSIFCPVYNISSRYPGALERFLDSVRNQTYTNIEVVLVDDGSTDDSAAVCDKWAQMDNRFRVVRHGSNKTINKARETGFRHCTGQFVFNADPDDLLHPQAIEVQHSLLTEHPECQAVFGPGPGPFSVIFHESEINFVPIDTPNYEVNEHPESLVLRNGNLTFWNKLFRRELLETIDWDVTRINDLHLMLQICLKISKCVNLKDTTYYWVQRKLSVTHTNHAESTIEKFDTLILDWNRYISGKHPECYADFLYRAYNIANSGYSALTDKRVKKAWRMRINELYELSWGDYIKSDAPRLEKLAMWWVKRYPAHKPFLSHINRMINRIH